MRSDFTDCDEDASIFDFTDLKFCEFESAFGDGTLNTLLFVPFALICLVIAMYTLGSTADMYLSPALETISVKLGCSESLAGVTLLALGNGAPDCFAAISAGGTTPDTITLMMSNLFGAVFFISCCVIMLVMRASPEKN